MCLPFLCLQLKFAAFGFVVRFVASENVRSNTAGTGKYGFGRDIPAVAEVP